MKDQNAPLPFQVTIELNKFSRLEFYCRLAKSYLLILSQTSKMLLFLRYHVHRRRGFYPIEGRIRYMTSFLFPDAITNDTLETTDSVFEHAL
jgi:hypothetical protein